MVEVSLEVDQVGLGEVQEEIGSFGVEVPVAESGTPERVLFVDLGNCMPRERRGRLPVSESDLPRRPSFRIPERRKALSVVKLQVGVGEGHTFHLRPSFLSDLSSWSLAVGNRCP